MARPKTFDLATLNGRQLVDDAYQKYMRPNWTLTNVAAALEVSPTTLRQAFAEAKLPLKVNHGLSPTAILKEQRVLRCPTDYLAAKYSITTRTINKWSGEYKRKLVDTDRAPSQRWWDAFLSRYEDPNDAVLALIAKPHGIPIHSLPPLIHKRLTPDYPVLWQLDSPTPFNPIDLAVFTSYSGDLTEPCDDVAPHLWLGYQDVVNPVQWINSPTAFAEETETEAYDDEESDLDLAALAEEHGVDMDD